MQPAVKWSALFSKWGWFQKGLHTHMPESGSMFTHSSRVDFIKSGSASIVAWLMVPIEAVFVFSIRCWIYLWHNIKLKCQFYSCFYLFATFFYLRAVRIQSMNLFSPCISTVCL
jgi:hypothetical protein